MLRAWRPKEVTSFPDKTGSSLPALVSLPRYLFYEEIQDAFGRITDNDWNHYLQDHHDLHKLPFDPKDPYNREKLLAIIAAVLAQGKESLYKNTTDIFLRSLEILPQVIFEVKYTFVEGVLRISDMWIKRN